MGEACLVVPPMGQLGLLLPSCDSGSSSSACMCVYTGTSYCETSFPCIPEQSYITSAAAENHMVLQLHDACTVYGAGGHGATCMLPQMRSSKYSPAQPTAVTTSSDKLEQDLERIEDGLPQVFLDLPDMHYAGPDVLQQAAQEPPVVHLPVPCPCNPLQAQGEMLHQQLCSTQRHADLGERAVKLMLEATANCHCGSTISTGSSTKDVSLPCLFKTSEQLDSGDCDWGLQLAKQRSAPAGQKRTRNGTSIPRNFNFCSNAPVQLQAQAWMWDLLKVQGSKHATAPLNEQVCSSGFTIGSYQLFSIRSCTQGSTAYALACHDSNSCEACLQGKQGVQIKVPGAAGVCSSTTSPGEQLPAASNSPLNHFLWCPTQIKCRKQRNRWQGHQFSLFKYVFVSIDRAKAVVCSASQCHSKANKGS